MTMAPNCESGSVLPVFQRPDPPTELSLLSQSMMDQQVNLIDSVYNSLFSCKKCVCDKELIGFPNPNLCIHRFIKIYNFMYNH